MMDKRMPETRWAVFKRQVINLRNCCIWLVDSVERIMMHGLANHKNHSTCFGRFFRLSSGVLDCTYSVRYMSYRFVDSMLAGTWWILVSARKQSTNLYDIYLMLYVQSRAPDDGGKDCPKHVEWYWINSKNCASSWFYYRNSSTASCVRP